MIERQFVTQKSKEQQIQEYIAENLTRAGLSHTKLQRTPLGEKITIFTSHPGLVVGRSGENIKKLTIALKKKFGLENPQIEISEIENPYFEPRIVGEKIAGSIEKFGSSNFKGVMHKAMEDVLRAGATGVEIVLSGKVPSTRAKSWRIRGGHMKKCGDIAVSYVRKAQVTAMIKTGMIGIKVNILTPDVILPDSIKVMPPEEPVVEDITNEVKAASKSKEAKAESADGETEAVKEIKQKMEKKKPAKKKTAKKEEAAESAAEAKEE